VNPSPRSEGRSPEDEISRLFALMMPERAAKPPRAVAAVVIPREVDPSPMAGQVEAEREPARDLDGAAILAALAHDRRVRARWETAATVLLACCFLAFVAVAAALRLL
jgi:hypothetical protein